MTLSSFVSSSTRGLTLSASHPYGGTLYRIVLLLSFLYPSVLVPTRSELAFRIFRETKASRNAFEDTSKTCAGLGLPPPALGHGSEGLGLSLLSPLRWTWPGPALPTSLKDINDQRVLTVVALIQYESLHVNEARMATERRLDQD